MSRSGQRGLRMGGFTLVEVLVALVIVAVGMSALMGALSSSAKTVTYMQEKTFAEWVALNQVASTRIVLQKGQTPPTGKTNGDIEFANRTWHWSQEVVASEVPGIVRIDVKVRPKDIKAGDDEGWYVTVSGIAGNALAAPGTSLVNWGNTPPGGGAGNNQGTSLGSANGTNQSGVPGSSTPTPRPLPPPRPLGQ